jgi:group I intron endonuclease
MARQGIIYKATCMINGKIYIGKTVSSIKKRIGQHKCQITTNANGKLMKAFRKYGFLNFKWEILDKSKYDDLSDLDKLEVAYIVEYDSYNKGYNSTIGGGGMYGFRMSEESKNKQRERMVGKYVGDKNPNYGNKMSEESKQIIAKANIERIKRTGFNPMNNPESVEKVRISKVGDKNPNYKKKGCFNHLNKRYKCEVCGRETTVCHIKRHHGGGKCEKLKQSV